MMHIVLRGVALGALLMLLVSIGAASATANSIPNSGVGTFTQTIDANALKPTMCSGLNLSSVVTGSGIFLGNSGNTLILGSSGIDTITGGSGSDCILGGGGADVISAGAGADSVVLLTSTKDDAVCRPSFGPPSAIPVRCDGGRRAGYSFLVLR